MHQVYIRTMRGKYIAIDCDVSDTVLELKKRIEMKTNIKIADQRLLYAGEWIDDNAIVSECRWDGHINVIEALKNSNTSAVVPSANPYERLTERQKPLLAGDTQNARHEETNRQLPDSAQEGYLSEYERPYSAAQTVNTFFQPPTPFNSLTFDQKKFIANNTSTTFH